MKQPKHFLILVSILLAFFLGCKSKKKALTVKEEPIIDLVKNNLEHNFSIVLHDMDVTEDDVNVIYRHKYAILQPTTDSLIVDSTGWLTVSEDFFNKNEENLGMELVSIHNGVSSTVPKPVGFDWAIGNEKYGGWVQDSTSTGPEKHEKRWRYHSGGRFLMHYWMFSRLTRRGSFRNYEQNYKGKKPFYGKGKNTYGTKSAYQRTKRSRFFSRKAKSSTWSSHTKRASRKSSRFRGGSRSRGRSRGFGK